MQRLVNFLNPQLLSIYKNVLQLEPLTALISAQLPTNLKSHCKVASFIAGRLTLLTTNAVFATELRYCIPTLRDRLRQEAGLSQLTQIKIHIDTNNLHVPSKPPSAKPLPLSNSTRNLILTTSKQCRYEPLKDALQKLAGL